VRGERAGMTDEEFIEVDAALHMAIVRATKNALLLRVFQTIQPVFVAYSRRVIELEGRRETAREGHRRIVEAIVGRRAAQARSAVVRHLRDVERDLVRQLAHGEPGSGDR
jgi:GntR family transcriptional repressor for pyruvate dehydrogenase complex